MPVWLHNIGLGGWEGWVGVQWMLITTTGRITGKPRQVMVDVMEYDKASDTYFIEAAYGARADWYRNMKNNPIFEAQVGRRKFKARSGPLSHEGAAEMLVRFYRNKPVYTRSVMLMAGIKFIDEADLHAIGKNLTLLAVKPVKD